MKAEKTPLRYIAIAPIAGIDISVSVSSAGVSTIAPIAGIDTMLLCTNRKYHPIAPHCGD